MSLSLMSSLSKYGIFYLGTTPAGPAPGLTFSINPIAITPNYKIYSLGKITTVTISGSGTFHYLLVGGGGGGGGGTSGATAGGGGGGGIVSGSFTQTSETSTNYTATIGTGGANKASGNNTTFSGGSLSTVTANGGSGATTATGGTAGTTIKGLSSVTTITETGTSTNGGNGSATNGSGVAVTSGYSITIDNNYTTSSAFKINLGGGGNGTKSVPAYQGYNSFGGGNGGQQGTNFAYFGAINTGGGGGGESSVNTANRGGTGNVYLIYKTPTTNTVFVTDGLTHHYNFMNALSYSYGLSAATNIVTGIADCLLNVRNLVNIDQSYNKTIYFKNINSTSISNTQCIQNSDNGIQYQSVSIWYKELAQQAPSAHLFDGRTTSGGGSSSYIHTVGVGPFWTSLYKDNDGITYTPSWSTSGTNNWKNVTFTSNTLSSPGSLTFAGRFNKQECANLEIAAVMVYNRQISVSEHQQNYAYYNNFIQNLTTTSPIG